jgi:large subunit ribosomal protein L21
LVRGELWSAHSGRLKIYAIIETGGKQYKVSPGQLVGVDRLDVSDGDTVELDKVLLIADDDRVTVGTPTVGGAKVIATSQGEGKDKKVIVFKYKSKVRYRKKTGHRQFYTNLSIDRIIEPEATQDEPIKKVRQRKKEVTESGT